MFGTIGLEFKRLEGEDQNLNGWKGKTRISISERIRSEFECSEG